MSDGPRPLGAGGGSVRGTAPARGPSRERPAPAPGRPKRALPPARPHDATQRAPTRLLAFAFALALLASPALAQEQPDPRRIGPLTGQPRPMFGPTSSEEHRLTLDACLARTLKDRPAAQAAEACHAEALAACEAIMALYPLAENQCALGVRLAWSDVRHEADRRIVHGLYARGDEASIKAAEAFGAADNAWRIENRDACTGQPDECELRREMDRAALYLAQAAELGL